MLDHEVDLWKVDQEPRLTMNGIMTKSLKWTPVVFLFAASGWAQETIESKFAPKFYAFENGVSFGSDANSAKTLKELGYDGISQVHKGGAKLKNQIADYEKAGLKVLSVYLNVKDKPIDSKLVEPLANRDAILELTVNRITPELIVAVRQTAEMAQKLKIRVALYPHHGNGVATMPHAMGLIAKVNHPNLGVMFNVCHFLKNENLDDMENVIEKAGDRLFAVSVCGANVDGKGWNELIKPLDQGDFPQERLLKALKKVKFNGPVGLQCYAVKGDKRANLQNSISAWQKALEQL